MLLMDGRTQGQEGEQGGNLFRGCRGEGRESVGDERERVRGLNAVRQTTLLMKI